MQTYILGMLFVAAIMAVSVGGVFIVRKMKWHPLLEENNQFAGYVYSTIGLIYGVFLAFTVIVIWQEFSEAQKSATNEVSYVSMIWRDVQVFPIPVRNEIQDALIAYSRAVVDSEWASMSKEGWKSKEAGEAYEQVWNAFYKYQPQSPIETTYYTESLTQLNELARERRVRLMHSRSGLPPLVWLFLIFGALITIAFTYLFWTKHASLQAMMVALLSGLIAASLYLTLSLQHPFSGDVKVSSDAFQVLVKSLEERKQKQ